MEAELMGLASSGATALVGLMVSDAWTEARERLARLLSRGSGDDEASATALRDLDVSSAELAAARADRDDGLVGDVEAHWRVRLRRLLTEDPGAAAELRALLAELDQPRAGDRRGLVHNEVSGGRQNTVVQGRDFSRLTFGGGNGPSVNDVAGS
ncbi:hypothetical protein ABZ702_03090 [Streptomyces cyaneofuscatus]|uniref:hypothetical protein n=1 Tax=Streptomyces cyaneofuscatus TaxID=66883 RepID=UPI0033D6D611